MKELIQRLRELVRDNPVEDLNTTVTKTISDVPVSHGWYSISIRGELVNATRPVVLTLVHNSKEIYKGLVWPGKLYINLLMELQPGKLVLRCQSKWETCVADLKDSYMSVVQVIN